MKDSEMWLVIDSGTESFYMIRLSDVSMFDSGYDCLEIKLVSSGFDWGECIRLDRSKDQSIVYKGTFLQCLSYVENKENYK